MSDDQITKLKRQLREVHEREIVSLRDQNTRLLEDNARLQQENLVLRAQRHITHRLVVDDAARTATVVSE